MRDTAHQFMRRGMMNCGIGLAAVLATASGLAADLEVGPSPHESAIAKTLATGQEKIRQFEVDYGLRVEGLQPGSTAAVWIPLPQTSEHQRIRFLWSTLPESTRVGREQTNGNVMAWYQQTVPASGMVEASVTYSVERIEVRGLRGRSQELSSADRTLFLAANSRVPVDGKPLRLLDGLTLPTEKSRLGRLLYDRVDEHMKYDKSRPGYGTGDSNWACDSRFGNCTDFHSLFISLARSQGLPARFEMGLPLSVERGSGEIGGHHCWAFFHTSEHGWIPTDISEADKIPELKDYYFGNLTENRVTLSHGRDINLVPPQTGPPLNYFVYPYVEANGATVPDQQIVRRITFRDIAEAPERTGPGN